ncbi:DUF4169 family protein [Yoonia sp. 208BN28-4]|uniref:DUF4169 family protein n=1 Tax=Yoonia sp. 208BN28-4 TaxID=3126505 RepID=UPI0030A42DE9
MTVVNLNKARKTRDKVKSKQQADENAVKFGRTKAERVLEATRSEQANSRLAQLKFEDE